VVVVSRQGCSTVIRWRGKRSTTGIGGLIVEVDVGVPVVGGDELGELALLLAGRFPAPDVAQRAGTLPASPALRTR
jgi:hypothetical protein